MATSNTQTRSLQGKWLMSKLNASGNPTAWFWVGNLKSGKMSVKETTETMKETFSGQRGDYKEVAKETSVTVDIVVQEFFPDTLAIANKGVVETVASKTGVTETSTDDLKTDGIWALGSQKLSNLVIKDKADVELIDGLDYTANLIHGSVTLISTKNLTFPLTATYDAGTVQRIRFGSASKGEYAHRFEGVNTSEEGQHILYEIFRSTMSPAENHNFIDADFAEMSLSGKALMHKTKGLYDTVIINDDE